MSETSSTEARDGKAASKELFREIFGRTQLAQHRRFKAMTSFSGKLILTAVTLLLSMAVDSPAFAQDKPAAGAPAAGAQPQGGGKGGGGNKRTTVNFEDELVEGQTQKPELFYLLQQRNNNFKRLIKLRENFLPEMRKTAEDVSRSDGKGSGN